MRRLPIFLVLDVSESMVGDELTQMEQAVQNILSTLRTDPYALETAFLSVIVFAGKAKTLVPLKELIQFVPLPLPVGGGTSLGAALDLLMAEIDRSVVRGSPDKKGDWKPLVFLVTDGRPTDSPSASVARWKRDYRSRANLVAVSVGGKADHRVLSQLTSDVVVFQNATPDAFAKFAKWVSSSIQTQSRMVDAGIDDGVDLSKADPEVVREVMPTEMSETPTDDELILVGRCVRDRHPYVMRFGRQGKKGVLERRSNGGFVPVATMPVSEVYFELTDAAPGQSANTGQLESWDPCPCCGNAHSAAACMCGQIHCLPGPGVFTCPWCGVTTEYGFGAGANVGRGRG